MPDRVIRLYCPRDCGRPIVVARPELEPPAGGFTDQPVPYPTAEERRWHEQLGRAVAEGMLGHYLFDCAVAAVENAECGHRHDRLVCNRQVGHDGDHEHQVDHPGGTVTVAAWPNLRAVRDA